MIISEEVEATKVCVMCDIKETYSSGAKYCKECLEISEKEGQKKRGDKYRARIQREKYEERGIALNENFNTLELSGVDFLNNNFNNISEISSVTYTGHFKMSWFDILKMYGKIEELTVALVDGFIKFHEETGSQSVKLYSEKIGSSSRFFKFLDKNRFLDSISPEKRVHSNETLSIEIVKARLPQYEDNLKIISDYYHSSKTELLLRCNICEFEFTRSWMKIANERAGCPACNSNGGKFTIHDIEKEVASQDYCLVKHTGGDRYRGTRFIVRCNRGHTYETSYVEFKTEEYSSGGSCKECIKQGYSKFRLKVKQEMVKRISDLGYTTEEEFINTQEIMTFKCEKGHERKCTLNNLSQFPSCFKCRPRKLSEKLRMVKRTTIEYRKWRKDVLSRDSYTCQCCGSKDRKLVSHHKDGYNWCAERRYDIENGSTLCYICHNAEYEGSFHSLYGNGDNTEAQFDEWMSYRKYMDEGDNLEEVI